MQWTKIPTDLLEVRTPDKELIAIVKYQLVWAILERQPDKETCLRYMTSKQYQSACNYLSSIRQQVESDIKSVVKHRNNQKMFYVKNQGLTGNTDGHTDGHTDVHNDGHTDRPDKIRLDNIILNDSLLGGGNDNRTEQKKTPPPLKEELKEESPSLGGVEVIPKKEKKFTPPLLEEVIEYSRIKGREDLAESFYNYYTPEWRDRDNKPIKNWKNKFNTWIMHTPKPEPPKKEVRGFTIEELRRIADEEAGLI